MKYTIITNGRSYDLPKKTLDVAERLDGILRIDSTKGYSLRQKFEILHEFVKELLGEEETKELLGGAELSEIDLSELTLAVRKIADTYEKPISDYVMEKSREKLTGLPVEKIISLAKASQSVAGIQAAKQC